MSNSSQNQFPLPGVAIIFVALGALMLAENPFNPTRPNVSNNLTAKAEDVQARLWQDPFEAVELHRTNKHKNNKGKNNFINYSSSNNNNVNGEFIKYQDKSHKACSFGTRENINNYNNLDLVFDKKKNRYVKVKKGAITTNGIVKESDIVDKAINNSAHVINELRCQIQRDIEIDIGATKQFDLHILGVMVTGGAYAENKETRIRSRYAVTTGLLSVGYVPKDPNHIGYLNFSSLCEKAINREVLPQYIKYCDWPAIIPYEWYKPEELSDTWKNYGFANNILVLWLDNEDLSNNKTLGMLSRLKNALTPGSHERHIVFKNKNNKLIYKDDVRVKFDVIGPASSTTLVNIFVSKNNECKKGDTNCNKIAKSYKNYVNDKIRMFSHRATLDDDAIKEILKNKKIDTNLSIPGFQRTITTDSMLVDNLLCEMLKRGINPYSKIKYLESAVKDSTNLTAMHCRNYSLKSLNKSDKKEYIVLVGEWDTVYTRNFNYLFRKKILDKINKNIGEGQKELTKVNWLLSFYYLRGLDGEIANKKPSSKDTKNKSSTKNKGAKDSIKEFRRPVGANQFDYLRRLSKQITDVLESKNNDGTIKAIGIVGSDAYDKLLILQALRNNFPSTLFFTTDLDARMLHQDENKWARNLVVASAYGLSPENNDNYVYKGLAFRDSYQTALYNTVQKITDKTESDSPIPPVKIFEIGNDSAVDYSHNSKCSGTYDKNGNCEYNSNTLTYFMLSLGLFIILLLQTSNKTRLTIFCVAIVLYTVAFWLYRYDLSSNQEFQAMFSGTSVWPAYILRMVASVLAILFIIYAILSLRKNSTYIIQEYDLSSKECISLTDQVRNQLTKSNSSFIKSFIPVLKLTFKWLFSCECYDDKTIKQRNLTKSGFLSTILITSWSWKAKRFDEISLDNLFYQYIELSKSRRWLIRVIFITIMYMILTVIFMKSFPNPPLTPFVGDVSADANKFILLAVLVPYVFLIFFVSDITRLNLRFVELLSKYTVIWPKDTLRLYCKKYGLNKDSTTEKLNLDLIITRSKVVDELIFLPFIILTLIILSRSSYFDRWHMPLQLAFIILLGACIALSSAIRLRKAAKKARIYALKNLNDIYKQKIYNEANPDYKPDTDENSGICEIDMSERLKKIITEIENISTGPFLPIAKHPIITAVAMPFGGVGGLYLIDYLSSMGV